MRFGHLCLSMCTMGLAYCSQVLKGGLDDAENGFKFGLASVSLFFFGPYLGVMHLFQMYSRRTHFGIAATALAWHCKDYYQSVQFEDAGPDDPL